MDQLATAKSVEEANRAFRSKGELADMQIDPALHHLSKVPENLFCGNLDILSKAL